MTNTSRIASGMVLAGLLMVSSSAHAAGAVGEGYKWMTFAVFGVIIAITMYITYWAARRTHTCTARES